MHDFYDVAVADAGLFQRLTGSPLSFENPEWDLSGLVIDHPRASVLLAETGHMVLSINLSGCFSVDWLTGGQAARFLSEMALLAQEQSPATPQRASWTIDRPLGRGSWNGEAPSSSASVRRAFDLLGFVLHEALLDRRPEPADLEAWSGTWQHANSRCLELHRRGEVATPYVATWGYHLDWELEIDQESRHQLDSCNLNVVQSLLDMRGTAADKMAEWPTDQGESRTLWLIGDFESIRTTTYTSTGNQTEYAADTQRIRDLIEYFAYRRGVVTFVQRSIVRCSIHEAAVRRDQVIRWAWEYATVVDDYILAGWSLRLLRGVRAVIERDMHTWDLEHREQQVRERLISFQSQFEAEQSRLSTALGLVFGVFAFTAVLPLLSFGFAWILKSPSVSDAPLERPWTFLLVNLCLLGVLLPLSLWLVRKAGSLRSPT